MRILVTNDDGVESDGLAALVEGLASTEHEILVVAPSTECSGASAAIGPIGIPHHFDLERRRLPCVPCIDVYSLSAYPAMCVLAAMLGGFGKPPAVVVAGVNAGPNVGRAVFHSGTVSATLTGAMYGARGLAVSLAVSPGGGNGKAHWAVAVDSAITIVDWLARQPAKTVINVNVPDCPATRIAGFRAAPLAPLGGLRTSLVDRNGMLKVELDLDPGTAPDESDATLLRRGYVTLTPLDGVDAAENGDIGRLLESFYD